MQYSSENFTIDLAIAKQSVMQFSNLKIEPKPRFESNTGRFVKCEFHGQAENSS